MRLTFKGESVPFFFNFTIPFINKNKNYDEEFRNKDDDKIVKKVWLKAMGILIWKKSKAALKKYERNRCLCQEVNSAISENATHKSPGYYLCTGSFIDSK